MASTFLLRFDLGPVLPSGVDAEVVKRETPGARPRPTPPRSRESPVEDSARQYPVNRFGTYAGRSLRVVGRASARTITPVGPG